MVDRANQGEHVPEDAQPEASRPRPYMPSGSVRVCPPRPELRLGSAQGEATQSRPP